MPLDSPGPAAPNVVCAGDLILVEPFRQPSHAFWYNTEVPAWSSIHAACPRPSPGAVPALTSSSVEIYDDAFLPALDPLHGLAGRTSQCGVCRRRGN